MRTDFFTTTQVAQFLAVDATTIINWINAGKLPAFITPGGHRRIKASVLATFLQNQGMPLPAKLQKNYPNKQLLLMGLDQKSLDRLASGIQHQHPEFQISCLNLNSGLKGQIAAWSCDILIIDLLVSSQFFSLVENSLAMTLMQNPFLILTAQSLSFSLAKLKQKYNFCCDYVLKDEQLEGLNLRLDFFKKVMFAPV
jgi:excisionase family DNA binding protein